MLRRLQVSATLLAALLAVGCAAFPTTAPRLKTLKVSLAIGADRSLMAVPAWRTEDVDFLEFKLVKVGATEAEDAVVMTQVLPAADVLISGAHINFNNLAPHTTYRLEARAYHDADASGTFLKDDDSQISFEGTTAGWKRAIAVTDDEAPELDAQLVLTLKDRPYDFVSKVPLASVIIDPGACFTEVQGVVSNLAGGGGSSISHGATSGTSADLYGAGNLLVAPNGDVYVALTAEHVIYRIDEDRRVWHVAGQRGYDGWPTPGSTVAVGSKLDARLGNPHGMAWLAEADGDPDLLVADTANDRILRVNLDSTDFDQDETADNDGAYISVFADFGDTTAGGYVPRTPKGLAVDAAGDVFVAAFGTGEVYRFDPDLNPGDPGFSTVVRSALNKPFGLARKDDDLVLSEQGGTRRLSILTPDGTNPANLAPLVSSGAVADDTDGGQLLAPGFVSVDHAGRVWVVDLDDDFDDDGDDQELNDGSHSLVSLDPAKDGTADYLKTWISGAEDAYTPADGDHRDTVFPLTSYSFLNYGTAQEDQAFLPFGVAVEPTGYVYFSDSATGTVRKLQ